MVKIADLLEESLNELTDLVEKARESGEDDLEALPEIFDSIAEKADTYGDRFHKVNEILSGKDDKAKVEDVEEVDEGELEDEKDEKDKNKPKPKGRSSK